VGECILGFNVQVDVVIEQRFYRCAEQKYWTDNAFPYDFWNRYLTVFSSVNIVARVSVVAEANANWKRVDGPGVSFISLPSYIGPYQFLRNLPNLVKVLYGRKLQPRHIIYRIPGILAAFYDVIARSRGQHYAAEVVGDPADVFAKGANTSVFRAFFSWLFSALLRKQCRGATAISYVTETSLQKRYPPNPNAFQTHYSSIQLNADDYLLRNQYRMTQPVKLLCIGNLSQPYKGCDFMLHTLARLNTQGAQFQLRWVGGGHLQPSMQKLANQLGLEQVVSFVGNLAERADINHELDQADVFVLSSRQEGLPRVLIEAMARSLVCVATNVGGVCELLPSEFIVERDDEGQLSAFLSQVSQLDASELLRIGQANNLKAHNYENSALALRRISMYQHLLDAK